MAWERDRNDQFILRTSKRGLYIVELQYIRKVVLQACEVCGMCHVPVVSKWKWNVIKRLCPGPLAVSLWTLGNINHLAIIASFIQEKTGSWVRVSLCFSCLRSIKLKPCETSKNFHSLVILLMSIFMTGMRKKNFFLGTHIYNCYFSYLPNFYQIWL